MCLIQDTGVTPNQLTFASLISMLFAALFVTMADKTPLIIGALLIQLSYIFDCSDGVLARHKKIFSPYGPWFDSITDRVKEFLIITSLTYSFGLTSKYAPFFGLYALFLTFSYHGQEIKKLGENHKNDDPENIITKINAFRKKIKWGVFSTGEQHFILSLFLVLQRIDFLFYVFTAYGTCWLVTAHLYKIWNLRRKNNME